MKKIIAISGGSGIGKNSILTHLKLFRTSCQPIKKYTTRTSDQFEQGSSKKYDYLELGCSQEDLLDCQFRYHYGNNWYGIMKNDIDTTLERGLVPVVFLRTGSMLQELKNTYPFLVSIYIQSIVDSDEYLRATSSLETEADKIINQKMDRFKTDFRDYSKHVKYGLYDYIVLNNFDEKHVLEQLEEIVSSNVPNDDTTKIENIFVIMSFLEQNQRVFAAIEKSAKNVDKNIRVERIDKVKGVSFSISQEIMKRINKSTLVICDLTDERPNVYFELGYAMGLNKKIIHCAKAGTKIHFDIANYKTIIYDESFDLQIRLEDEIRFILKNSDPI